MNKYLLEFIKDLKSECVQKQEYENAANLRDKQNRIENSNTNISPDKILSQKEQIKFGAFLIKKRKDRIDDILK